MSSLLTLAALWLIGASVMFLGWRWQCRHRNAGIADVLWSALLAVAAVLIGATGSGGVMPRVLLIVFGGSWALRLAWHLAARVRREDEDGRYQVLRARWHGDQRRWFVFFQLQAASIPLFALPFVAVANNPRAPTPALVAGTFLWLVGVLCESLADRQLARFRADPTQHGRTCNTGLWRYSRHPNYFFEWVHWFAYVAWSIGSPLVWLAWLGPLTMFIFLRYLSGVPWTEQQALRTRGADYRRYQRRTSSFFPWFSRSPTSGTDR